MTFLLLRRRHGFTLVEVMLMIVVGIILASAAIPNLGTLADAQVAADARVLAADIQFAQARALATSTNHRVSFDVVADRYQVESPPGTTLTEPLAKKPWIRVLAVQSSGTQLVSAAFGGQANLDFDPAGRPTNGGSVVLHRGDFSATVSVAAVTGEVTLVLP